MAKEKDESETLEAGPGAAVDRVVGVEGGTHSEVSEAAAGEHAPSEHSFWPIIVALGLLVVGIGMLYGLVIAALGGVVLMVGTVGWLWEPWTS